MLKPALLISSVFAAVCIPICAQAQDELAHWNGKAMPAFSIQSLDGKTITNASLKGKVVMFDFWATWCGPCKMASPAIDKLSKLYKGKKVVFIGADILEQQAGPQNAKGYKAEHGYGYTFTYNSDKLASKLGITSIPAFLMVDQKGIIRGTQEGIPPQDTVNVMVKASTKKIDQLLKG